MMFGFEIKRAHRGWGFYRPTLGAPWFFDYLGPTS